MPAQRKYKDADGSTRYVQMDDRTISGGQADVPLVRPVGGLLDWGSSSTGNVFDGATPGQVPKNSADFDCDGFETVVLRFESANGGPAIKVRPWLKDASGQYAPLPEITVKISQQSSATYPTKKTSYYHCEPIEIATRGAKAMRFQLTTLGNGTVAAWASGR